MVQYLRDTRVRLRVREVLVPGVFYEITVAEVVPAATKRKMWPLPSSVPSAHYLKEAAPEVPAEEAA